MGPADTAIGVVTPAATPRAHEVPVYVHPGQLAAGRGPRPFATILGSCVAVCLFDPVARAGGLNHFILPGEGSEAASSGRYAAGAIAQLLHLLLLEGVRRSRLQARVVGGANVLSAFGRSQDHLGLRNVRAATDLLAGHGIPIVGTDVGGTRGRRVLFQPRDGGCVVHLLGP